MKTPLLVVLLLSGLVCLSTTSSRARDQRSISPTHLPVPIDLSAQARLASDGTAASGLARAAGDTFWIYGGPGSLEGGFETAGGAPDPQGWSGVDRSDTPVDWQVHTFNAATLGGHGVGNHAAWAGYAADQVSGWVTAPGYGNGWNEILSWTSPPLLDPSVAQTVELDFHFHHDSEPGYDFFTVEYDSAGFAPRPGGYYTGGGPSGRVLTLDGSDKNASGVFSAPGVRFSDVQTAPIAFTGNDYGGDDRDRVVILLRFASDGGWSDEDGLWPTDGAVQIDDIVVRWDDGSGVVQESFEDFEGVDPLRNGDWRRVKAPFAGDFTSVLPGVRDIDPCWENRTPLVTFVDYGQTIGNAASAADLPGTPTSTGGSTSPYWSYGPSGGAVLNYTGGVSKQAGSTTDGPAILFNEFWSPPIDFDLPGTADDGVDVRGILFEFDEYTHMPLLNGMFWLFQARAKLASGEWTDWRSDNFVHYNDGIPEWQRTRVRLDPGFPETDIVQLQVSLGVWDLSATFGFPGADATPGFYFDNVAVAKLRLEGPRLSAREIDLALGGFPNGGGIDASTPAARAALDVRFDMARDIAPSYVSNRIDPGDSVVVDVLSVIPGAPIADLALVWVLDRNPLFDDVRTPPAGPRDRNVDIGGATQWSGETIGAPATTNGTPIANRYFFDLPDADFLHPGDVLRYYIRAEDTAGRVSTLPRGLDGLADGKGYPEEFTVRALPSIVDASGTQPPVLVVDLAATPEAADQTRLLLDQLGWRIGVDYDYTRRTRAGAPRRSLPMVSDGIGGAGAHGANVAQLSGYRDILVVQTDTIGALSDGSGLSSDDKCNDIALLRAWMGLAGDRSIVHLGTTAPSPFGTSDAGAAYGRDVMGFSGSEDLPTEVSHLGVRPAALTIGRELELYGGCVPESGSRVANPFLTAIRLESKALGGGLRPNVGLLATVDGIVGHDLVDAGAPTGLAATVFRDRVDGLGDRKFGLMAALRPGDALRDPISTGVLPTTEFVHALVEFADVGVWFGVPTSTPRAITPRLAVAPTPFNPRTEIALVIPRDGHVGVHAYDARGRRVRTLLESALDAGTEHRIVWDGRDDQGRDLASGVYFVAVEAPGWSERRKVALVR